MKVVRIIFQAVIGLIFGLAATAALSPFWASLPEATGVALTLLTVAAVALFLAVSPSIRRTFGRGFLSLGACVFLLPLSTLVLSGVVTNELVVGSVDADKGMAAAGGVLAGGAMTALAGLVGFVMGSVLLLIGLVLSLGGRREVIVVERRGS